MMKGDKTMTKEQRQKITSQMLQVIDFIRRTQTEENSEMLLDYFEMFFNGELKQMFHTLRQDEM